MVCIEEEQIIAWLSLGMYTSSLMCWGRAVKLNIFHFHLNCSRMGNTKDDWHLLRVSSASFCQWITEYICYMTTVNGVLQNFLFVFFSHWLNDIHKYKIKIRWWKRKLQRTTPKHISFFLTILVQSFEFWFFKK